MCIGHERRNCSLTAVVSSDLHHEHDATIIQFLIDADVVLSMVTRFRSDHVTVWHYLLVTVLHVMAFL